MWATLTLMHGHLAAGSVAINERILIPSVLVGAHTARAHHLLGRLECDRRCGRRCHCHYRCVLRQSPCLIVVRALRVSLCNRSDETWRELCIRASARVCVGRGGLATWGRATRDPIDRYDQPTGRQSYAPTNRQRGTTVWAREIYMGRVPECGYYNAKAKGD